jgi:ATP-dependent RNA helicase DDX54/DBP10
MPELQGFGDGGYQSEAELDTRALVQEQNRKKKKSGGFQSMGLSYNVYHGVMKCGYKIPTPIQRKVSSIKLSYYSEFLIIFFYSVFH